MDGTATSATSATSANLVKWQRASIAALLMALLVMGFYSSCQLRYTRLNLKDSERRTAAWRQDAAHLQDLLQKERNITEDLKLCMTFDRTYIHKLEGKIAKYEGKYGRLEPGDAALTKKPQ